MTKAADKPLGAFINLESTGPGGPDYVFQHTGVYGSSHEAACMQTSRIYSVLLGPARPSIRWPVGLEFRCRLWLWHASPEGTALFNPNPIILNPKPFTLQASGGCFRHT